MRKNNRILKEYMKYSGMGIEMVLAISFFVFLGRKLDAYLENETPWGLLVLSLLGCVAAIYILIRRTSQSNTSE